MSQAVVFIRTLASARRSVIIVRDDQVVAHDGTGGLSPDGLGVAIVPQSVAHARRKQLHTIAITRPALRGRIALAWRTEGPISPAARALITRARAVSAAQSADHCCIV